MFINASPRAFVTSCFMLLTLLSCALCAPVSAVMQRDIWVPQITSPTSASKWTVGGTFLVTWDTSSKPARVSNPIGEIYLRQEDRMGTNPIASGFELSSGQTKVTYMIVLFGDSGNFSEEFPIVAAT
ncbi:hypothetical protein BDR07DRAFT_1407516 [Suillus spraguei]|nr:hypothetical protein BDR07DRAFT_1407516 [Suillus spraguei]